MTFSRREMNSQRASSSTCFFIQRRQGVEVKAVERFVGREPRRLDAPINHPGFAIEQLQLNQPGKIADMIRVLGGALAGQLLMLAQHRRQLQLFEMMAEQDLGGVFSRAHAVSNAL